MHTITIKIDDSYFKKVLDYLKNIPADKREFCLLDNRGKSIKDIDPYRDGFLKILENGPSITDSEAEEWIDTIRKGYSPWSIEEF